jgi:hypothetical protein
MKINTVSYLGFLGLFGFLGPLTGNAGFYGFFGFLGFLSAFAGTGTDERIENNINRSCRNSFLLMTTAMSFSLVLVITMEALEALPFAFVLLFVGSMVTFVFSYIYYDRRGD